MIQPERYPQLQAALPFLGEKDSPLGRDFAQGASIRRVPAGTVVFVEGDECGAIAILLSGAVRVYKTGETGREITLYRFEGGESCILTANCILSQRHFPAIATVERDAEAVFIPAPTFRGWVDRYPAWRDYVFQLLSRRLSTVMEVVNEIAFRRMDARVADLLRKRQAGGAAALRLTHQDLADELGTSREVVSRILEDFTAGGLVATGRGTVTVLDAAGLAARAAG
jgi:CRP/FNR family transcriptional regulator